MKRLIYLFLLAAALILALFSAAPSLAADPPRLLVLTDIGADPDDQQSMIRLMVYANEFEIEGLIATARGAPEKEESPRPDLIRKIVRAYGKVRPNLAQRAAGWPPAKHLEGMIKTGSRERGRDAIGEGKDTEASRWIIERIDAGTPERPLNLAIWGGQADFAQALWRVKQDRQSDGLAEFVRRFRVYDVCDQDDIAEWMRTEFPGMTYILSRAPAGRDKRESTYRGIYLGGDESLTTREWIQSHVRRKGPLGALYPLKTWTSPNPHEAMKEGDTPSWFFFLPAGGNDPKNPSQPGWGGQFQREVDGWYRDLPASAAFDPRDTVSRWRPAFQADFAKRMSWCLNGEE